MLLAGCASKQGWNHTAIQSGNKEYNTHRLVYPVKNPFRNLEIEFCRIGEFTTVYINVHSHYIPPLPEDEKKALIFIKTKGKHITLIGDLLEGGQRLKLPPLASKHLIDALRSSKNVTISLDSRYETPLDTTAFKEEYRKFMKELSPLTSNRPVGLAI